MYTILRLMILFALLAGGSDLFKASVTIDPSGQNSPSTTTSTLCGEASGSIDPDGRCHP